MEVLIGRLALNYQNNRSSICVPCEQKLVSTTPIKENLCIMGLSIISIEFQAKKIEQNILNVK